MIQQSFLCTSSIPTDIANPSLARTESGGVLGLLWSVWFEADKTASPEAILKAAISRYIEKHGVEPNRVRVPLDWPESLSANGLTIERCRNILPRHVHLTRDSRDQAGG